MYRACQTTLLITSQPRGQTDVATTTILTLTYSVRRVHFPNVRCIDGVGYTRPENDIRARSDIPPEA